MTFFDILKQFRQEHRHKDYVGHRDDVYFRHDTSPSSAYARLQVASDGGVTLSNAGTDPDFLIDVGSGGTFSVSASAVQYDAMIESTVAAGGPVLKIAGGTTDNPTVNIVDESGSGGYVFSASASGWVEILSATLAMYIPYWA
jgi:hypothetical protein